MQTSSTLLIACVYRSSTSTGSFDCIYITQVQTQGPLTANVQTGQVQQQGPLTVCLQIK